MELPFENYSWLLLVVVERKIFATNKSQEWFSRGGSIT